MTAQLISVGAAGAYEQAARLLRAGQLVAIPTETVYGLAVLPAAQNLRRLLSVKRRSTDKGIQLLIDSLEQVRELVEVTTAGERLAQRFWPGPLTLVLDLRPEAGLSPLLTGSRPTVGLRLPDHEVPRRLARELGPLAASSANLSGEPPATTAERVMATLAEELALVLDGGPAREGLSSTVVSCRRADQEPLVLREGALSREQIRVALADD
jgi:L-threonylcarbamoyladenylate synthase